MYYLFVLAFFCNLYSAVNNIPHILLIQDEKSPVFDFLINQTDPDPNRKVKFHCKLDSAEIRNSQEDLFPIQYLLSYFSEDILNKDIYKESHKIHKHTFYDHVSCDPYHQKTDFVLVATGDCCQYLFSYLNSIKNDPKQIRCIFIHNPILPESNNANITQRYKKELLRKVPCARDFIEKLPHLDIIIPLFYEFASNLTRKPYDAFKREIIHDVDDIASSSSFCTTPFVITHYGCPIDDDTKSLYEILLNDRFKNIKNPVLLLDSSITGFKVMTNNIISTCYKNKPFMNIMQQNNGTIIESNIPPKTTKGLENARWFGSKTPRQQFIIRRVRDIGLLTMLFGIIFCCSKTIKAVLSYI